MRNNKRHDANKRCKECTHELFVLINYGRDEDKKYYSQSIFFIIFCKSELGEKQK